MHATLPLLEARDFPAIHRRKLETLQVNVGYRCNQSCVHCHVNAGPKRTEEMSLDVVGEILAYLRASGIANLDITGGAPELNPHFRELVIGARELGAHVIDRCNLTIFEEAGFEDLPEFLARHEVEVIASLPCYLPANVDRQRGGGVFDASIRGLQRLNALGYGQPDSGLALNLVFNPQGPSLPPEQGALEADYRTRLRDGYGVVFDHLYTLANMPIARFGSTLISTHKFESYMDLLRASYRPENLADVMCRSLISVDWQGYLYDCDFNQMLGLPLRYRGRTRVRLGDLIDAELTGNEIVVKDHCFGCTAGQGSSCGGALKS